MQIHIVYDELRTLGAVGSSSEFSQKWLGRERSYLTVLKAKRRKPSCTVWATCAVRLLRAAEVGAHDNQAPRQDVCIAYRSLASRCLDEVLTEGLRNTGVNQDRVRH